MRNQLRTFYFLLTCIINDPNIPSINDRLCSKQIVAQRAPRDKNRKNEVESYYLRNIAFPFLDNKWKKSRKYTSCYGAKSTKNLSFFY